MAVSDYFRVSTQLYIAYFGRPADAVGLRNFAAQLDAAGAPADLAGLSTAHGSSVALKHLVYSMGTSMEANALYGAGDDVTFVSKIYQNMLGREPRFEGLKFWTEEIASGRLMRTELPMKMMAAAFTNTSNPAQAAIDQALINKKISVGLNFTSEFDSIEEIAAYVGSNVAQVARSMMTLVDDKTNIAAFQEDIDVAVDQIAHRVRSPRTEIATGTAGDDVIALGPRTAATGAGGQDVFDFRDTVSTEVINFPTIGDLSAGDKIAFKDAGEYARSTLGSKFAGPSGDNLAAVVDAALSGSAPGELRWFHYFGNTFVVNDASAATSFQAGTDQLIRLIGTHDLSTSTVSDAGVLTFIGV